MGGRSGVGSRGRLMPGEGGSGEGRRVHRGDRVVCGEVPPSLREGPVVRRASSSCSFSHSF